MNTRMWGLNASALWCAALVAVLGLLSVNAEAQRAPTIHYRPSNSGGNTDRFSSPEEAGRVAVERTGFTQYQFYSVTPGSIPGCCPFYLESVWGINYLYTQNGRPLGR
jgi:hypothetical protein